MNAQTNWTDEECVWMREKGYLDENRIWFTPISAAEAGFLHPGHDEEFYKYDGDSGVKTITVIKNVRPQEIEMRNGGIVVIPSTASFAVFREK